MAKSDRKSFHVGKIPPDALKRLVYPHTGKKNRRLIFGPGIGVDSAAVRENKHAIVFKTDPVTGTASHIGSHSIHINANDIATTGAKPVWFLCTILLPPGTQQSKLKQIMLEMDQTSRELGITIIGGHCEATKGLDRPMIIGFMIGEAGHRLLSSRDAKVGDRILLTKTAGLEGSAIIAWDHKDQLRNLDRRLLDRARKFAKQLSIVKEALPLSKIRGIHALHDPTEGGVLNGLWELAEASGLGIRVSPDNIPVEDETIQICHALGLDPLKLMSSGTLLVAVAPRSVKQAKAVLKRIGVRVSDVGLMLPRSKGRYIIGNKGKRTLSPIIQDELYRLP
ncbi:MAG TPA: AIR synthase family protein [Candidatus Bathyarchaeia archaeon]|nr:AIR synthase family protein [Candidatus Bathyarchaeia archaeon]